MQRLFLVIGILCLFAAHLTVSDGVKAQEEKSSETNLVSPNLVISQFQTGGGGATPANDEFIEIHNTSTASVDLNGYRVVYRSATGTIDVNFATWTSPTILAPGGYYLIANSSYDGATPGDFIYNSAACSCGISATGGGFAIRFGALNAGVIVDSVGYGTATNAFIETAVAAAPAANGAQIRASNACQDTDNNANDFSTLITSAPRNAATPPVTCAGGGTQILANGAATPNSVAPNSSTLLTVSVFPATNPPSTGISVTGNLTNVGGAAGQQFFDDGTNGDVTASDNIFSFLFTIPANASGGARTIQTSVTDAQARSVNPIINLTINAIVAGEDPLIFGNPSNATADIANEFNYLMNKPQYSLSYHRTRGIPNWVAWRLDSTWVGTAPRQDDYRPDTSLPAGWYQVLDSDYSGSGYDRGHMCPSGDRTRSVADNSATFLMTNFVPQLSANNQGPWEEFETYCRTLAQAGNEIYIFTGGQGSAGTIAAGRVTIPLVTWKVAVVLPNGDNDLQRVSKRSRVIAIVVPNQPPLNINAPWRNFRRSVDYVEALTGLDFFTNVPKISEELLERRIDWQ